MTVSSKAAKSAKSVTKSHSNHHNPATPETTTSPAPVLPTQEHVAPADAVVVAPDTPTVTAAASATASGSASPVSPIVVLATKAVATLDAIEAMLNLDIVIGPNDKHQIGSLNRISDTAIGLAADIVSAAPDRFPDFADLPAAASYVHAVGLVASRAKELATHVQKSVQNQRAPAATKTLALYAVAKGLGRIKGNETMREKVTALKTEIAPKRKNPKPKLTAGDRAVKRAADQKEKRVTKAMQVLAAAGVTPPATAASAPPSVTPPPAPVAATPVTPVSNGVATPSGAALAPPTAAH